MWATTPGVTVEKKQGVYKLNGHRMNIVDLPGTYSLTAYSLEEVVARDFLVNEKPGVVINIVDASNLERNLYLTLQFIEMGMPVCHRPQYDRHGRQPRDNDRPPGPLTPVGCTGGAHHGPQRPG